MRYALTVSLAVAWAMLLLPALRAAEAPQAGESDLRAKMKALEERVRKLEDALARERGPRSEPRNNGWQFRGLGPDMDQLIEQLQRQAWSGWQQDLQPVTPGSKPRLGVRLDPPSDELRERFKNDVKEGAFVTEIVPGSPAENGGLNVGDCITSFNGKDVRSPTDLIDAVKAAPQGKTEIIVARRGEALKLKVELSEPQAAVKAEENDGGPGVQGRWLWRKNEPAKDTAKSRVEVKANALELGDELAKDLKLSDEQKKNMSEVLGKHSQALTREAAVKTEKSASRRLGTTFSLSGDVSSLVNKHVAEAEKELAGTLSADQLKQWADYRKQHSSLSISHSVTIENSGRPAEAENGDETMNF